MPSCSYDERSPTISGGRSLSPIGRLRSLSPMRWLKKQSPIETYVERIAKEAIRDWEQEIYSLMDKEDADAFYNSLPITYKHSAIQEALHHLVDLRASVQKGGKMQKTNLKRAMRDIHDILDNDFPYEWIYILVKFYGMSLSAEDVLSKMYTVSRLTNNPNIIFPDPHDRMSSDSLDWIGDDDNIYEGDVFTKDTFKEMYSEIPKDRLKELNTQKSI